MVESKSAFHFVKRKSQCLFCQRVWAVHASHSACTSPVVLIEIFDGFAFEIVCGMDVFRFSGYGVHGFPSCGILVRHGDVRVSAVADSGSESALAAVAISEQQVAISQPRSVEKNGGMVYFLVRKILVAHGNGEANADHTQYPQEQFAPSKLMFLFTVCHTQKLFTKIPKIFQTNGLFFPILLCCRESISLLPGNTKKKGYHPWAIAFLAIFVLSTFRLLLQLSDGEQGGSFHHAVARGNAYTGYVAVALGGDVVLHLHGFEHENGVAFLDSLSGIY